MYILQCQVYVTQKKLLHVKYLLHVVFPGLWCRQCASRNAKSHWTATSTYSLSYFSDFSTPTCRVPTPQNACTAFICRFCFNSSCVNICTQSYRAHCINHFDIGHVRCHSPSQRCATQYCRPPGRQSWSLLQSTSVLWQNGQAWHCPPLKEGTDCQWWELVRCACDGFMTVHGSTLTIYDCRVIFSLQIQSLKKRQLPLIGSQMVWIVAVSDFFPDAMFDKQNHMMGGWCKWWQCLPTLKIRDKGNFHALTLAPVTLQSLTPDFGKNVPEQWEQPVLPVY